MHGKTSQDMTHVQRDFVSWKTAYFTCKLGRDV